jgi:aminoglycoside phosphotransferase (APT) family kinase protein
MTEPAPGAGSDPSALSTRAVRVEGGWRIDGHKWFITGAIGAGFTICMARTSGSPGDGDAGGATMFLVDAGNPGMTVLRHIDTLDESLFGGHAELVFDNCVVPDDAVLGKVDEGFRNAQVRLGPVRMTHCMRWLGVARRARDIAVERAATRRIFGAPLGELGMAQQMIADNDLPVLERFFRGHLPGFAGHLTAELLHGGRSNLTYVLSDGQRRWVLRRPPLGGLTPSAHDMSREYRVVAALRDSDVPVARAVLSAEEADEEVLGVPFSIFEYVDGRVIRTTAQLHELPANGIARCGFALIDVLVRVHAVDPRAVGLKGFGQPRGYLARQVRRWYDQWQRVRTRQLADIDALHAKLAESCPVESGAAIVHGDYRIDNAILDHDDAGIVRAVVDWEMATLGDPLADLGLHLVYTDPAFAPVLGGSSASTSDRLPPVTDLAERYAVATGRDLSRLGFYLGLGYFKIAVIAEGIHARFKHGMTRGSGFETVGEAVAPLAAAGLRAVGDALGRLCGERT